MALLVGLSWPAHAQWSTASLSQARDFVCSTSSGNKVFFAGGDLGASRSNVVDIYDNGTGLWTTSTLSIARRSLTAAVLGQKVYFSGGYTGSTSTNRVDIYDIPTGAWTQASLSIGRNSLASAVVGTKLIIAGGTDPSNAKSAVIDIYDSSTGLWTTATLSVGRDDLAGVSVGTKVLFGGGNTGSGASNAVDIYDNSTGLWTTATLSQARYDLTATVLGNKVFFAGGIFGGTRSNVVDIYDNSTGLWSTATLSQSRYRLSSAAIGNKVLFAGGNAAAGRSTVVDVYDIVANSWSTSAISLARDNLTATAAAGKIFVAGGATASAKSEVVDIYTELPAEPNGQPSNLIFNPVGYESITLNYTAAPGNPTGYLIVRSTSPTPVVVPVDGVTYSGAIGAEEFIDVGNAVTLLDEILLPSTLYYYTIYAYNGTGSSINYRTITPLTGNQTTGTTNTYYSRQSGNFNDASTWSNISHTGIPAPSFPVGTADALIGNGHTVTMTSNVTSRGNSEGLKIEAGGTLNASGFDMEIAGTLNIVGNLLNPGSISNSFGGFELYNTSGNLLIIDQLIVDNGGTGIATLHADLVVLNGLQVISGTFDANGFGLCDASITPPITPVFTNKKSSGVTLSWTNSGSEAFIVMRQGSTSFQPDFGTAYNANPAFGSGDVVGTGNFVVYKGTGTTVNITGLSPATNYEFDLYSYSTAVGGCYSTTNYQLALLQSCSLMSPPANPINASYCVGDTKPPVQVNTPGSGRNINWYDAATAGNQVPGDGTGGDGRGGVFIPNAASGTFYAEIYDGTTTCVSDSRTAVTLTLNPAIVNGAVSANQSVCIGGNPGVLDGGTATGGSGTYTYEWGSSTTSGGPYTPIGGAVAATYDPPAGISTTTYYQRIVRSGTCSALSAQITVTVVPLPVIATNPQNAQVCTGSPASFSISATGASLTYQWQADNGSGFANITNGAVYSGVTTNALTVSNVAGLNNARYQCVVTSLTLCGVTTAAAILTVNAAPAANNQAISVCETSPGSTIVNLTNLNAGVTGGAPGVTVGWFTNSGLTNPVPNPASATVTNGTIFYADVQNSTTLCRATAQATITVTSAPVASFTPNITICSGTFANISPTSTVPGTTYAWTVTSNAAVTGASNGSGASIAQTLNNTATTQQSITYTITPKANGCDGSAITVVVHVDPIPSVFNVTGGGSYCAGTPGIAVGLSSSQPGVMYTLLNNGASTGLTSTPGGGAFNFPNVTAAGTYTVSGSTGAGCQRPMTGSVTVSITNFPSGGTVDPPTSTVCIGESVTLTVNGVTGTPTSYNWVLPSGVRETSRTANTITVVADNDPGGRITVTPVNTCGNGAILQASIIVQPPIEVSINLPDEVNVNVPAAFSFSASTTGNVEWTFGDGQTSTDPEPVMIFTTAGSTTVDLMLTDTHGCTATDSKSFEVLGSELGTFSIKNVVTANGDGDNDFLTIVHIEKFPDNEVILLDRWGAEVFRQKGYANDWDLKKGENYLPSGNYVCVVRYNGEVFSRTVTVLKSN